MNLGQLRDLVDALKDLRLTVRHRMLEWLLQITEKGTPGFVDTYGLRGQEGLPDYWPRVPKLMEELDDADGVNPISLKRQANQICDVIKWAAGLDDYLFGLFLDFNNFVTDMVVYKPKKERKKAAKKTKKKARAR